MDALEYELKHRIMVLEMKIEKLHEALTALISWTAQSAASPINQTEAELLMKILRDEDE
jgi:hypothetical protein